MLRKDTVSKTILSFVLFFVLSLAANAGRLAPLPVLHQTFDLSAWNDTAKLVAPDSTLVLRFAPSITINRNASGFVAGFLKKEAEFLAKMKTRSLRYFQTIEEVLNRYSIPPQLKYLSIVESELRPDALSGVGARGLWQLMPVTAKELGLRVAAKTDERTHTYRSTVAAAKYLQRLYKTFGDWLLVLAAYNGGPGTVYKAMKKAGSKNFWALQRFLPTESRGHVKRFIGVHFFFEGQGSIATQTAAEAKAHRDVLHSQKELIALAKTEACLE